MYVGVTGYEGTGANVPDIRISISGDKVRPKATTCTLRRMSYPAAIIF